MSTTTPGSVASVTATTTADAPGASRPRLHVNGRQVPCDARSEMSRVPDERGIIDLHPIDVRRGD